MTMLDDVAAAFEGGQPCSCVKKALVYAARICPGKWDDYGHNERVYALAAALVMEKEERGSK